MDLFCGKYQRKEQETANSDGNHSEDSVSLKEHLYKLGMLDGKIGASESNLSAQITIQFEAKFFLFSRRMTASKQR